MIRRFCSNQVVRSFYNVKIQLYGRVINFLTKRSREKSLVSYTIPLSAGPVILYQRSQEPYVSDQLRYRVVEKTVVMRDHPMCTRCRSTNRWKVVSRTSLYALHLLCRSNLLVQQPYLYVFSVCDVQKVRSFPCTFLGISLESVNVKYILL